MDLGLKDKVIIVSGGANGIGAAISTLIAEEGGIPFILDKDQSKGNKIKQGIEEKQNRCEFIHLNLSNVGEIQYAINVISSKYPTLDGLVNNAGVNDSISLEHGNPLAFISSLEKNLFHYYNLTHFVLPYLKKTKGAIVNISSKTAVRGQGGSSGYTAAKGAQLALTRDWAIELLPYHIRVNAVVPAEVWTSMYENWIHEFPYPIEKRKQITDKIPLEKRMTRTDEIANMVVFLLSERSSHITGQHIFVDGGYSHLDRAII